MTLAIAGSPFGDHNAELREEKSDGSTDPPQSNVDVQQRDGRYFYVILFRGERRSERGPYESLADARKAGRQELEALERSAG